MKIRSFTTFLAYFIFFIGAITQGLLVYLLLVIFVWNREHRKYLLRSCVKYSFKFFVWLCSILCVYKTHFEAFDKLNNVKGAIFIANHPTLVDYVIISSKLGSSCSTMVKHSLTHGFMGPIIRHLGYVDNESNYEIFLDARNNQENFLIFPEGTRTRNINEYKFHRGAANISCRLNMPIYPIYISCDTPNFLSDKFLSLEAPPKVPNINISVGDKIDPQNFINDKEPLTIVIRHYNKYLENLYNDKLKVSQTLGLY